MINIKLLDEYINIFSEKDLLNLMKKNKNCTYTGIFFDRKSNKIKSIIC